MSASGSKPQRKNQIGSRLDIGWKCGIDVDKSARKVQCKFCNKVVAGGIYRFKHHLAGTRKDSEPCISVPDDVKQEVLMVLVKNTEIAIKKRKATSFGDECEGDEVEQPSSQSVATKGKGPMDSFLGKKTQATVNHFMKRELREDVCQQIARWFYVCAIPFNCVNNQEFSKMVELIGRYGLGLKPPSYYEIREKYLNKEVKHTMELLEEHKSEWKKTGCSIMSDGWTDRKRRSLCNFMVNSPKGTVFLCSIDTSDVSKTAHKVYEMLDEIVEKVGEENVVQVVTDNAANYKAAGELLMKTRKKLYWTPCAAHCIDLMLEDFEKKLKLHQTTITKARKISTYIYTKTNVISMLRHFTKGKDLIRPAVTRFATAYLTLGSLNDLKGALITMFTSATWKSSRFASTIDGKKVQQFVLDSRFWRNIVLCLKAAFPLIKVLRMVDSDEQPAMGFLYNEMDRAKEKIKINFNNLKKNYEPILQIIETRWELQLHRPLHSTAHYLNPHYHYSPDFKVTAEMKIGLYSCLERMVADSNERCKIDMQLEKFKDANGLFGIEAAKAARNKKAPAKWWDSYGDECPELQKFAIRVLSLTCSSSGCERNWSAFEMVHTKKRNRLLQKKMNDLVFVMYNLKLKDRKVRSFEESFDNLASDDEWITEKSENSSDEFDDSIEINPLHVLNSACASIEIESEEGIANNLDTNEEYVAFDAGGSGASLIDLEDRSNEPLDLSKEMDEGDDDIEENEDEDNEDDLSLDADLNLSVDDLY